MPLSGNVGTALYPSGSGAVNVSYVTEALFVWGSGAWRLLLHILLAQVDRLALLAQPQVEHLDENRKSHGEVDVALRDVLVEPLGDQRHADQQQEAQGQHLDRGMARDELTDRAGGDEHHAD